VSGSKNSQRTRGNAAGKLQKDGLTGNGRVSVPNREKPKDRVRECYAVVNNRSLRSSKVRSGWVRSGC
jgi:hypothetical protein